MDVKKLDLKKLVADIFSFIGGHMLSLIKLWLINFGVVFLGIIGMVVPAFFFGKAGGLFFIVIAAIALYILLLKMMVSSRIFVDNLDKNTSKSFGFAFKMSKGRVLNYFGASLMVGLIMLVPTLVIRLGIAPILKFNSDSIVSTIAQYIVMIPIYYIQLRFAFIPTIVCVRNVVSSFDYNNFILDKNYWHLATLYAGSLFAFNTIFDLIMPSEELIEIGMVPWHFFVVVFVAYVVLFFVGTTAPIVTLRSLEALKDEKEAKEYMNPTSGQSDYVDVNELTNKEGNNLSIEGDSTFRFNLDKKDEE